MATDGGEYNQRMARPDDPDFPPHPETATARSQRIRAHLIETLMHIQPGFEFLDWETLWVVEWLCEKNGSINEGGPDLHEQFVRMSEDDMRGVVRATIYAFRMAIDRACAPGAPEYDGDDEFFRMMRTLLYLAARGNIRYDDDWNPIFYKPTGPPPNPEMRKKILGRLYHDHPMHLDVALELTERMRLSSRPGENDEEATPERECEPVN